MCLWRRQANGEVGVVRLVARERGGELRVTVSVCAPRSALDAAAVAFFPLCATDEGSATKRRTVCLSASEESETDADALCAGVLVFQLFVDSYYVVRY